MTAAVVNQDYFLTEEQRNLLFSALGDDIGFDLADEQPLVDGLVDGAGDDYEQNGEHEKRKGGPNDDEDDSSGHEGKRTEHSPDDETKHSRRKTSSSSPGREPSNKRKAQNRAAQRAFRERKERHLKELETRVAELEATTSVKDSENDFLRKQVQQLQSEINSMLQKPATQQGPLMDGQVKNSPFTFHFPYHANRNTLDRTALTGTNSTVDSPTTSLGTRSSGASAHAERAGSSYTSSPPGQGQDDGLNDQFQFFLNESPAAFDAGSDLFQQYREPLFDEIPAKTEPLDLPPSSQINCNKLWDRVVSHPEYEQIDIDRLCGDLRHKATCSETGVAFSKTDVDHALSQQHLPRKERSAPKSAGTVQ